MKFFLGLVVGGLLVGGFFWLVSKAQPEPPPEPEPAHRVQATKPKEDSQLEQAVRAKAKELGLNAPESSLTALQDQLAALQTKIHSMDLSGEAKDLSEQMHRLTAAVDIKKIQAEMDDKVKDLMAKKDAAAKTMDDAKRLLAKGDAEYQALQQRLKDAKKTYDNLTGGSAPSFP